MESDRERRDRVREIKQILKEKKKSRESRGKIGRKEGRGQERERRESWIRFHFLSRAHRGE